MQRTRVLNQLNHLLQPKQIRDYAPNGLQVEGKMEISRVITGVTASEALIDAAIDAEADAIIVHHGYFWRNEESTIVGMKQRRLKKLLAHDINLFAYHLPLDVHPVIGNNKLLGEALGLVDITAVADVSPEGILYQGRFPEPQVIAELSARLHAEFRRAPLIETASRTHLSTIAWCTGGGQKFIDEAVNLGVDAFLSGEVSESTIHTARECDIAFLGAGHHATERYGVLHLAAWINAHLESVTAEFIDIPNPA